MQGKCSAWEPCFQFCPELRAILADALEQAEPGATLIVPMTARNNFNLRTHPERIIKKAGHAPWPRLRQILRARCETDWVENYPGKASEFREN